MSKTKWVQPENEENYETKISVEVEAENEHSFVAVSFEHSGHYSSYALDKESVSKLRNVLDAALAELSK